MQLKKIHFEVIQDNSHFFKEERDNTAINNKLKTEYNLILTRNATKLTYRMRKIKFCNKFIDFNFFFLFYDY